MRRKLLFIFLLQFSGAALIGLLAQEALVAGGGVATDGSAVVSYSVGQVAFQTVTNGNASVAEGVQQPFEISQITHVGDIPSEAMSCAVYPNPSTGYLVLKVQFDRLSGVSYRRCTAEGRLLKSENVIKSQTNIPLDNFIPSIYFLTILRDNFEVKTFQVIKN